MFENVSRRTFLKGSAATAALAAAAGAGSLGMWQSQTARADELHETKEAPSLCNGCSSKCGLVATTVDGQLWTLRGSDMHPYAKGHICGRGHGLAQMAYSDERVTQPLRRKDDGTFEPIDWDTAFAEIGERVKDIIAKNGPEDVYKRQRHGGDQARSAGDQRVRHGHDHAGRPGGGHWDADRVRRHA